MKKLSKLLIIALCGVLVCNPVYVGATEDATNETNNTTENSGGQTEDNTESNIENNTGNNTENNENENGESLEENNPGSSENKPSENQKPENNTENEENKKPSDNNNIEVEEETKKSTDATLKSLSFLNSKLTLNEEFKSDVFQYNVTVPADVNSISKNEIKYELSDSKAEVVMVNIPVELKTGSSAITVIVRAEDGKTEETYKFNIIKEQLSLNLKKLEINGYALNEIFDPSIQTYTVNIPYEVEIVTVNAITEAEGVSVSISGDKNLVVGQNVVKITVGGSNVYKIIVTRDEESSIEENPTSIITSSTSSSLNNSSTDKKNDNNSQDDGIIKYVIVSFASLLLFAIGGIGIYFYLKTSPKRLKKELDKISNNTEKEEITPVVEVSENQEIVNNTLDDSNINNNISEIMNDKLIETREFTKEELENEELENLFDDEKDV